MCIITDICDSEKKIQKILLSPPLLFIFASFGFRSRFEVFPFFFFGFLFFISFFQGKDFVLNVGREIGILDREGIRLFRWWTIDASCVSIFASREGFSRCETAVPFSRLMDFHFGERGR